MDEITFKTKKSVDFNPWHNKLCVYDIITMDTPKEKGLYVVGALAGIMCEDAKDYPGIKNDIDQSQKEAEAIKGQLVANGGKWADMYTAWPYHLKESKGMSPADWIRYVRDKGWTFTSFTGLSANGSLGADFLGNINEYSAPFFFRIFDRETVEEIMKLAPEINDKNEKD